jgi:hypothetical protein
MGYINMQIKILVHFHKAIYYKNLKRIKTWQDVQHQYMDIAQLAEQRPAPHVVAATAATVHTHPRPT